MLNDGVSDAIEYHLGPTDSDDLRRPYSSPRSFRSERKKKLTIIKVSVNNLEYIIWIAKRISNLIQAGPLLAFNLMFQDLDE